MNYVIIDIETTGLDKENCAILEVAALKIANDKVVDKFDSFCQYKGEVPQTIKVITGIREEMVENAPPLQDVLKKFRAFCEKLPIVAHNGFNFDYQVLEREGVKFAEKYDSLEFAFFCMPTNPKGHSMSTLSDHFQLEKIQHRALSDCQAEFEVIHKLLGEFQKKPKKIRGGLIWAAKAVGWWWAQFLKGEPEEYKAASTLLFKYVPYRKENTDQDELGVTKPVSIPEIEEQFVPKAGTGVDDYSEVRPEQTAMATTIGKAFNESKHALIEAGTGTGKSKAYLVPSLLFGLENSFPVIISTHTKALQDQLFFKELEHIKNTINPELRVAMLKGKKNYVCMGNFNRFEREIIENSVQKSLYEFGKEGPHFTTRLAYLLLLSWVWETERGDWDEIPYWVKERIPKYIEEEVTNFDEMCGKNTCKHYDDETCFLARARKRAKDADLVIINHALTLSGIIPDEKKEGETQDPKSAEGLKVKRTFTHAVFPAEAKYIVFDEAHHLEENATTAWEFRVSHSQLILLQQQLYGKRGARYDVDSLGKTSGKLGDLAQDYFTLENEIKELVKLLFETNLPLLLPKDSDTCMLDAIPERTKKAFFETVVALREKLQSLDKILMAMKEDSKDERMSRSFDIRLSILRRMVKALIMVTDTHKNFTRYLERSGKNVEIVSAPISVATHLQTYLFENFHSVVMTSATLTVDKSFNYFMDRTGLTKVPKEKVLVHQFKSSFDYQKQVRFFLPKGYTYVAAKKDEYLKKCAAFLEKAVLASQGGALILCSSYAQVDQLRELLEKPLAKQNIWLLSQAKGTSVSSIVRDFKKDTNSVLIGTETLWQGVDVPGESLRALFIYKIPYRMPEIPIIKARCQRLREQGKNPYKAYYEPLAAMLLKQGFGRLIRKSSDIGVAVCMDEGLRNKQSLLESLPEGVRPYAVESQLILDELARVADLAAAGKFNVESFVHR